MQRLEKPLPQFLKVRIGYFQRTPVLNSCFHILNGRPFPKHTWAAYGDGRRKNWIAGEINVRKNEPVTLTFDCTPSPLSHSLSPFLLTPFPHELLFEWHIDHLIWGAFVGYESPQALSESTICTILLVTREQFIFGVQSPKRRATSEGAGDGTWGAGVKELNGEGLPCPFMKIKNALILQKFVPYSCASVLKSHLK